MKIGLKHRLKAYRKASREIVVFVKAKTYIDRKKENEKYKCRNKNCECE